MCLACHRVSISAPQFRLVNPVLWFPCCFRHSCPKPHYIVSSFKSLMTSTYHTNGPIFPHIWMIFVPSLLVRRLTPLVPLSPQFLASPQHPPILPQLWQWLQHFYLIDSFRDDGRLLHSN